MLLCLKLTAQSERHFSEAPHPHSSAKKQKLQNNKVSRIEKVAPTLCHHALSLLLLVLINPTPSACFMSPQYHLPFCDVI